MNAAEEKKPIYIYKGGLYEVGAATKVDGPEERCSRPMR